VLRLRVDSLQPTREQLAPAASAIESGGIVAFPTDTFYGLAVDPRSSVAVRKLFQLKLRSGSQPLPLIADNIAQVVEHVGQFTPTAERLAKEYWPGALTLIIAASPALCAEVTGGTRTVAVRVPDHRVARALAHLAGHAVTATSANLSGFPPPANPDEVAARLGDGIDVLVDSGTSPGGLPSTIVDTTAVPPRLVRAGAIEWERVLKFLG